MDALFTAHAHKATAKVRFGQFLKQLEERELLFSDLRPVPLSEFVEEYLRYIKSHKSQSWHSKQLYYIRGTIAPFFGADTLTTQITFDPFSRQWIYVLTRGAYGMLRSAEGWTGHSIAFIGTMTMLGPTREWRMTWRRDGRERFSFVNEECLDGQWTYIDEWRFIRSD